MNKKTLLRKDQSKINGAKSQLSGNLTEAQKYLDWFNGLEFTTKLKTLAEVKQFLTNPHHVYENQVKKHLSELSGLKTLPPNIDPLISMYQIPKCQAWSVSEKYGFEFLQIDKAGKLFYSQEVYDKIEIDNNIYATPEQDQALTELNRTYQNCMDLVHLFSPDSDIWRRLHKEAFEKAFDLILKDYKDKENLTMWDLEKLEKLALAGFGKMKKSINK